ncbi:MAG: YdcF family protein [Anaerolineae bacterium]|nr:YdcF family protein [Anaerolineae bacterium]
MYQKRFLSLRRAWLAGMAGVAAPVLILVGLRLWITYAVRGHVYTRIEDVPAHPVALVLGAGLWADGSLTPVLADRVATAAELYHAGKVQKLLLSGDNRFINYNEPKAMMEYAIRLGVPEEDIVLDYAGRRTYDSCYRARRIFGVERAVVVTQRFHAPRALYLCHHLGVDAVAALADRQDYTIRRLKWETREYLALALAWWDINVRHPVPVLGEPLPIELSRRMSHDGPRSGCQTHRTDCGR